MTTLEEKVNCILDNSDFNSLPFEERKRIGKYLSQQQILTLHQVLLKDRDLTNERWRKHIRDWLKNCVESHLKEYGYD